MKNHYIIAADVHGDGDVDLHGVAGVDTIHEIIDNDIMDDGNSFCRVYRPICGSDCIILLVKYLKNELADILGYIYFLFLNCGRNSSINDFGGTAI